MSTTLLGQRPVLYQFWRSSASWRVRWALAIKGVEVDIVSIDFAAREHHQQAHLSRSPIGTLPALQVGERHLSESVAILGLLEDALPEPPLFPRDPWARARVRQVMELVNSEIQPFQSPVVRDEARADEAGREEWVRHFNRRGLVALEKLLLAIDAELGKGSFAVGDTLTAADLFVVPQVAHSRRFGIELNDFPRVLAAESAALATPFAAFTAPARQPDAPKQ